MLHNIAISGYRSLRDMVLCLGQLNLITGPNGSGKSNIYRALRLLSDTADGSLVQSLAREGGLQSTLWAGPETISNEMKLGQVPIQGGPRKKPVSLRLGFSSDVFCYTIELGLPARETAFFLDPVVKRECLWRGPTMRPRDLCTDRRKSMLRHRPPDGTWHDVELAIDEVSSMLTEYLDPTHAPEVVLARQFVQDWRFYDQLRTDAMAPARQVQVGTFSPVLAADGSDVAAAMQTIIEIGDHERLAAAIDNAFPGSVMEIEIRDTQFELQLEQPGMLRKLSLAELSDGTLRYLLLLAALFTPRPPECMVLNEPETSLHPDLLSALAKAIADYAAHHQIIVVTHSSTLVQELSELDQCVHFQLEKSFGATELVGIDPFDIPRWKWPAR